MQARRASAAQQIPPITVTLEFQTVNPQINKGVNLTKDGSTMNEQRIKKNEPLREEGKECQKIYRGF